jgi:sugar phosphate isomerase/epimerase
MLEQLSVIDLDPLTFLEVAARASYDGIGLHMEGLPFARAAKYSLIDDLPLRAAFAVRMRALGLRLHVVEPFVIMPDTRRDLLSRNLDIGAELGASVAGTLSFDPDASRGADALAQLNEDAQARGLALSIEPYALSALPTLSSAFAAARGAGGTAGVTLDVLHVVRGGEHWTTMPDFDSARVRSIQISDGPWDAPADRVAEATSDRQVPGDGAFRLETLTPLLPHAVPIGVEAPSVAMNAGADPVRRAIMLRERTAAILCL